MINSIYFCCSKIFWNFNNYTRKLSLVLTIHHLKVWVNYFFYTTIDWILKFLFLVVLNIWIFYMNRLFVTKTVPLKLRRLYYCKLNIILAKYFNAYHSFKYIPLLNKKKKTNGKLFQMLLFAKQGLKPNSNVCVF